ncbi:hypothetical protein SGMN_03760 [Stenotrophomonas geniculata]
MLVISHCECESKSLVSCYADLPPHEAVLVFGSNYSLDLDDGQWLQPDVPE